MMKPAKTKPLSPIMERHTPQHPLPEEIKVSTRPTLLYMFCVYCYW